MVTELKPCPKCGSRILYRGVSYRLGTPKFIVRLRSCFGKGVTCFMCGYHKPTRRAWNRRAAHVAIPTVLELEGKEVVYCKDCKHWCDSWVAPDGKHVHGECHMEDADDVIVGRWGDDFCSYGERKCNEETD